MREFYDRTGHDIKDMLLSCYYRGVECSAEDFKVVSGDVVKRPPRGRPRICQARSAAQTRVFFFNAAVT